MSRISPHISSPQQLADLSRESYIFLGAGAAVLLQLANPGVGWGVSEHSTTLLRPLDRLRTTMTYVYALTLGTREERDLVTRLVNRAHAPVRSHRYNAFDPQLQLWVAATLYRSSAQLHEIFCGTTDEVTAELMYQHGAVYGTALQTPPELWPADRASFERYWHQSLAEFTVDSQVLDYAHAVLNGGASPWWARALLPLQQFATRGLLDPHTRETFGLTWNAADERRWKLFLRWAPRLYWLVPRWIRHAPARWFLRDMRRRIAAGAHVI